MWAQILYVEEFQAGAGDLVKHPRDVRHLAAGKDEPVDEFAVWRALRVSVAVGGRDPVIERDPARPKQARDRTEICRQVR